ncbi:M1 family metallopeptidase [Spirillospora sp. CA-294931]|uniref:M1 family metallopeptidase n=1 Tax=Spirillospora sp. CA-294931 TaxID=3240042 RepID=UPI003D94E297
MAMRFRPHLIPVAVAAVGLTALALAPATSAQTKGARYTPGAAGVGDPYFPHLGNGGYDVGHYKLDLAYDPDYDQLDGTATLTATATQDLSAFNLDLSGLDVEKVTVDGRKVDFKRRGTELTVTPRKGLRQGSTFTVAVTYGGVPKTIVGSPVVFGSPYGFLHTNDGAYVGAEPDGASTWFPSNDHPSDKARYDFSLTVPEGLGAVANGVLTSKSAGTEAFSRRRSAARAVTYNWHEDGLMATYLATIDIGKWDVKTGTTPGGVPMYVAIDPDVRKLPAPGGVDPIDYYYDTTAKSTDLWVKEFGEYPFNTAGAIIDDARFNGQPLGFSLETNGKPVYSAIRPDRTIAHEMAHQWWGNSVAPKNWQQIWLNESFARWSNWYWTEKQGGNTVATEARNTYNAHPDTDAWWNVVIADPKRDTMFHNRSYHGGGMVLQFLREKIGHETFMKLLRTWYAQNRDKHVVTEQFAALAEQVSGQDLDAFFKTWIYSPGRPPLP